MEADTAKFKVGGLGCKGLYVYVYRTADKNRELDTVTSWHPPSVLNDELQKYFLFRAI